MYTDMFDINLVVLCRIWTNIGQHFILWRRVTGHRGQGCPRRPTARWSRPGWSTFFLSRLVVESVAKIRVVKMGPLLTSPLDEHPFDAVMSGLPTRADPPGIHSAC